MSGKPSVRTLLQNAAVCSAKKTDGSSNSIVEWINRRESTCFICNSVKNTFQAYMKTFFSMYKKDVDFRAQVANTKGFCLDHFKVLCEGADEQLSGEEKKEFYATVLPLMKENFHRVYEDVAWFIEKYDYKKQRCQLERFQRCHSARHAEIAWQRPVPASPYVKKNNFWFLLPATIR